MAKNLSKIEKSNKIKKAMLTFVTYCIVGCGLILSGFGTVLFYEWFSKTDEFNLRKFEINNSYLLDKQEVEKLSGLKKGQRVLDINLEAVRDRIKKSSYVIDCEVKIVLPATISISVEEEVPIAYLLKNGKLKYISENSQIIGDVKPQNSLNLPLINGKFSGKLVAFLSQARDLSPFVYHQISEICESDIGIKMFLTQNSVPVIAGREDFSEKILVVENFLKEEGSVIDYTKLEYIDLRFDKQVVVKEINSEVAEAPLVEIDPLKPQTPAH